MGFDFTIAVVPSENIDTELQYIKSALLYADRITLISPLAYLYAKISTDNKTLNELNVIQIMEYIIPICEDQDPVLFKEGMQSIKEFKPLIKSKQYKALPMREKLKVRRELVSYAKEMDNALLKHIGESAVGELKSLLNTQKLVLQPFEHKKGWPLPPV